jgi:hypothetical protein
MQRVNFTINKTQAMNNEGASETYQRGFYYQDGDKYAVIHDIKPFQISHFLSGKVMKPGKYPFIVEWQMGETENSVKIESPPDK